jgi:hypothetical protein
MAGYAVDENGRYSFPMMPGDTARITADCSCGWGMDGPERVWNHLSDSHATAHNKGRDGLSAAGSWQVQRTEVTPEQQAEAG